MLWNKGIVCGHLRIIQSPKAIIKRQFDNIIIKQTDLVKYIHSVPKTRKTKRCANMTQLLLKQENQSIAFTMVSHKKIYSQEKKIGKCNKCLKECEKIAIWFVKKLNLSMLLYYKHSNLSRFINNQLDFSKITYSRLKSYCVKGEIIYSKSVSHPMSTHF